MDTHRSTKLVLALLFIVLNLSTYWRSTHQTTDTIEECLTQVCSYEDTTTRYVHFPFLITNDSLPRTCGYPGFDLLCNGADNMLIDLPNSGLFSVQAIDYGNQELWINDPGNCLPKRLLSVNFSRSEKSPFFAIEEQVYWLYNCSSDYLETLDDYMKPIGCLSGSGYGVVATLSFEVKGNVSSCVNIGSVRVPVGFRFENPNTYYSDLTGDIRVGWVEPGCGECVKKGGQCGFKSKSSLEVQCFNLPRHGLPKAVLLAIVLAFAAPLALFAFCVTYYIANAICFGARRRGRGIEPTNLAPPVVANGLDRSTIESYPKVVLGESRRLPKPDDKSCPICLGEYLANETLRTLPHCGHCFHAECVDEWLHLNASCPVCRDSPRMDNIELT